MPAKKNPTQGDRRFAVVVNIVEHIFHRGRWQLNSTDAVEEFDGFSCANDARKFVESLQPHQDLKGHPLMQGKKRSVVTVRMTGDLHEKLKDLAHDRRMSMNQLVVQLFIDELESNGAAPLARKWAEYLETQTCDVSPETCEGINREPDQYCIPCSARRWLASHT